MKRSMLHALCIGTLLLYIGAVLLWLLLSLPGCQIAGGPLIPDRLRLVQPFSRTALA